MFVSWNKNCLKNEKETDTKVIEQKRNPKIDLLVQKFPLFN